MLIYHQLYSFYSRDTVRDTEIQGIQSEIQGIQSEIQGYRGYSQRYEATGDIARDTKNTYT